MGWITNVVDSIGMGIAPGWAKAADERQLAQQSDLNDLQRRTAGQINEDAQRANIRFYGIGAMKERMEKAGMNPALMYGQGGVGGTTAAGMSSAGGSQAPSGSGQERQQLGSMALDAAGKLMQGAQLGLLNAQKENIEADTANKRGDAENKPLVGENLKADTGVKGSQKPNIDADTANKVTDNKTKEAQAKIANIDAYIAGETQEEAVSRILSAANKEMNDSAISDNTREISNATQKSQISIVKSEAVRKVLENALIRVQTGNAREITPQIRQQIRESVQRMEQNTRNLDRQARQDYIEKDLRQQGLDQNSIKMIIDGIDALIPDAYFKPRY